MAGYDGVGPVATVGAASPVPVRRSSRSIQVRLLLLLASRKRF
jgi:hypothetical protein